MMPTLASAEPVEVPATTTVAADEGKHVLVFTETAAFRHRDAIDTGVPLIQAALTERGITSEWTNDSAGFFTPEKLATYDAVVLFQASGDPWSAAEKEAFIAYQQAGGATVGIHNATDMRGNWAWYDSMVGSLMPGHAATGANPGQQGVIRVEDRTHPSTQHLGQRWQRGDEWYNFSTNVRGTAHVLATMDETTYTPGARAMGYDHPISWCDTYDGGNVWMTGMGHFGSHYSEPAFMDHIVGGIAWASGLEGGDCGGTDSANFEKVALDTNTSAPFGMDVLPDGRVIYTELVRGQIRLYNPATQSTLTSVTIPVYSGGEDGLLGIAADPNFTQNGYVYVYRAPASANDSDPTNFFSTVSRFTMVGDFIDPATEQVVIKIPARRLPDEPGHTGGVITFDNDGNLVIGVGDDVNPHSEPSGGYAPLSTREGTFHDARATSANTNDLRGKILKVKPIAGEALGAEPGVGSTYTIPTGNLFPVETSDATKTRPEIYAMGFRNPFQFAVDPITGALGVGDYSPDNRNDAPETRGPAGIAEWNYVTEPGFYGWPLCMGNNEPFRDVDYGDTAADPVIVGEFFDCNAPINDSPRNTGLTELPPAQPADIFYGYQRSSNGAIAAGTGLAPMGGPFYQYDETLESDTKFPEYYEGKPFFFDWSKNKMFNVILKDPAPESSAETQVEKVNPFLANTQFLAPLASQFGPDGSLYMLEWGGGFGRDNPNSGLYRIDYINGSRSPIAAIEATPDSGPAPLQVSFDGSGSSDPEGEAITYAWDFDGDGIVDSTDPVTTHTYTAAGQFNARLTVTDPHGKLGTVVRPITVGNTRPVVEWTQPLNGAFFEFGDNLDWAVSVTDAEDTSIDPTNVIVQPALGHDQHAHPTQPSTGLSGTTQTSLGGHDPEENIFFVLDARYTDQGAGEAPALTGSATTLVFPKKRQAEFHSDSEGLTVIPGQDPEGYGDVIVGSNGGWAAYDPTNLIGIDALGLRVASDAAGTIELRRDAPDGELLGTAEIPQTPNLTSYVDIAVPVTDPGDSFVLYVVFPGEGERRVNFIEGIGQGVSPTARPSVEISAPAAYSRVDVAPLTIEAQAAAGDHDIAQVEFFVDGQSVGVDTQAPYSAQWTPSAAGNHSLTAVVTDTSGTAITSRIVHLRVGDPFGPFDTYTNAGGQFTNVGNGEYEIVTGGRNIGAAQDEYSTLYQADRADQDWSATVKVTNPTNSNARAKAGIIVRNDVTATGTSGGYAVLAVNPTGNVQWIANTTDPQHLLNSTVNVTATGTPTWLKLVRKGAVFTASYSKDGQNFTPIGTPTTVLGAASIQDIGLIAQAQHATNKTTARFADWNFDDDPNTDTTSAGACLNGKSVLTLRLRNTGTDTITVTMTTPFGTKTFPNVGPKGLAAFNFAAPAGTYPAGEAVITTVATGGGTSGATTTIPFTARTCS